jgi:hypothetical protein
VRLLGAAAVSVPAGFGSPAQRAAAAHPAAAAASFALDPALTEVKNPNANELTITPTAAGQAIDDHTGANGGAGNGGDWKVEYHWAVPTTLVPGKTAAIYLQIIVDSENPPQPNGYQSSALAPDFAQALPCHYPEQSSCSKTFEYPLHADQAGSSEIVVSIHMLSAEVDFHYRPASSSTPPVAPPRPVVVPTPSGFDQTVTVPEPPPGGTAIITSPALAAFGATLAPTALSVDVNNLTVRDLVIIAARHDCYVQFVKAVRGVRALQLVTQGWVGKHRQELLAAILSNLASCVAFADAYEQVLKAGSASVAGASCAETPVRLTLSGSGTNTRLRSFQWGDKHPPLQVSCRRHAGGLTLSLATGSKQTPLSSVVGPRLTFALARSRTDPPGGQLSVTFHHP